MGIYKEPVDHLDSVYRLKSEPEDDVAEVSTEMEVKKFREDQQLVFGWASIALTAKGTPPFDWQDDLISPSLLEKAAYDFVLKYRATGENHEGGVKGTLVESIVFTKEKMAAIGIPEGAVPEGWWVGFYIPSTEVFGKIKDGTYKMFSIQGKIKRIKV